MNLILLRWGGKKYFSIAYYNPCSRCFYMNICMMLKILHLTCWSGLDTLPTLSNGFHWWRPYRSILYIWNSILLNIVLSFWIKFFWWIFPVGVKTSKRLFGALCLILVVPSRASLAEARNRTGLRVAKLSPWIEWRFIRLQDRWF